MKRFIDWFEWADWLAWVGWLEDFVTTCKHAIAYQQGDRSRPLLILLKLSPFVLLIASTVIALLLIHAGVKVMLIAFAGWVLLMTVLFLFMVYCDFIFSWDGVALLEQLSMNRLLKRERWYMERYGVADQETYEQTSQRLLNDLEALKQRFEALKAGNL